MKCVSEIQFMQLFCYFTVYSVPIRCKILLGDVRRIAFTDDKIQVKPECHPLLLLGKQINLDIFSKI